MDRVQLRGKKRAKLRIDPHRTAGGKVVFDEEGAAMQPLELLAQDELGRSVCLWSLAACSMLSIEGEVACCWAFCMQAGLGRSTQFTVGLEKIISCQGQAQMA